MEVFLLIKKNDKKDCNIGLYKTMKECEKARKEWAKKTNTDEAFFAIEKFTIKSE